MPKITRKEEAGKIDVSVAFEGKRGFTFGVRGVTLRFSSSSVEDIVHRKVSQVFNDFFYRSTLKVPVSVKFNMIENLCNRSTDLHSFLKNWNEQRLYAMPQEVTDIDPPPPPPPLPKGKKPPKERAPRDLSKLAPAFQAKYTYPPEILTPEAKKRYRAKARAEARKEKE